MAVYVIGQIRIVNPEKWMEYKSKVIQTLEPFGGSVLLRASHIGSLVGTSDYSDIVAIEFESENKAKEWYVSDNYQSLIPIREKGAEITLHIFQ